MKTIKNKIYKNLIKTIKSRNKYNQSKQSKHFNKSYTYNKSKQSKYIKSFSPSINRKLDIRKLKTLKKNSIKLCNNLLEINIGTKLDPICLAYNKYEVKKFLLKNLMASKNLDVNKFIPPKQLYSNCWFNTMFVTFFFSDKGRKFFRFFRNLMITGKKFNNTEIKDKELRKLLFILNLYIEASYNQESIKTKEYNLNLHTQIKILTYNLDTNYLIKKIYDTIKKNSLRYSLPNLHEAGNPLDYYKVIMNYLEYDILKILNINIDINLINKYENINNILPLFYKNECDIIIFEDHESKINYKKEYNIQFKNKKYKYILDSIILTNKDHYNPKANSHFVSVLTINKEFYKFDGSSYSKLSKFDWINFLNKNIDWTFKENPNYHPEKYNFKHGYKILFYYRV